MWRDAQLNSALTDSLLQDARSHQPEANRGGNSENLLGCLKKRDVVLLMTEVSDHPHYRVLSVADIVVSILPGAEVETISDHDHFGRRHTLLFDQLRPDRLRVRHDTMSEPPRHAIHPVLRGAQVCP